MGFQRCPLPRHPFPKNEQGFAPSLSFTWFFKRKIKKNKSVSTKIKESHHLSHLGEGCVTLLLPYCYLILLGFPFFHTVKTPRPLGSASERRTREDLKRAGGFHGGFDGGFHKNGLTKSAHGSTLAISENYQFFGRFFMTRLPRKMSFKKSPSIQLKLMNRKIS